MNRSNRCGANDIRLTADDGNVRQWRHSSRVVGNWFIKTTRGSAQTGTRIFAAKVVDVTGRVLRHDKNPYGFQRRALLVGGMRRSLLDLLRLI